MRQVSHLFVCKAAAVLNMATDLVEVSKAGQRADAEALLNDIDYEVSNLLENISKVCVKRRKNIKQ